MTFGERLIQSRKAKNITQKALAEILEITPTRLNYWEKDKREPPVDMINRICEVLDINGDYLLGRLEKKGSPEYANANSGDQVISIEESNELLVRLGYIKPGEQLSDNDLMFLSHVIGLIDSWFSKRE